MNIKHIPKEFQDHKPGDPIVVKIGPYFSIYDISPKLNGHTSTNPIFSDQVHQVFEKTMEILVKLGLGPDDVLKIAVIIAKEEDDSAVMDNYRFFFAREGVKIPPSILVFHSAGKLQFGPVKMELEAYRED